MESFLFQKIKPNVETDNLLYNIINSNEPKNIFLYGVIITIGIFISINIFFNYNILVGLLLCSLIIYYIYTYNKYNLLTREKINSEKFNSLYSKNNILQKYPDIVDFLYYIENFKSNNVQQYEQLIRSFENFIRIYEYCVIDNNLIFKFYQTLISQKLNILYIINSFIFTQQEIEYQNILIKQKIEAEKLIDKFMNYLVILNKKNIYYDGYSSSKNDIKNTNILPYNILFEPDYKSGNTPYNIANLTQY
jgi:hypothetical protein